MIFGQELPEATASLASQIFGLCVALVGLATFALVLALLQQVNFFRLKILQFCTLLCEMVSPWRVIRACTKRLQPCGFGHLRETAQRNPENPACRWCWKSSTRTSPRAAACTRRAM